MIKLRPLEKKDIPFILEWMKDDQLNQYFRFNPESITEQTVEDFVKNSFSTTSKNYAVVLEQDDEYLGTISLKEINEKDKHAEYAVAFRKKAIGKGIARTATTELLKKAFIELSLNKVYLNVYSDNIRAAKLYEKCGFRKTGFLKQHVCLNNEFKDLFLYEILKEEFTQTIC